ncbi:hypothetical protein SAMN04488504_10238 [Myxococcus virescens]|uniref:Uncharacterized protein n=1 Tax=Myxococcus virescens TaxID=83456 RepID=A0ABY0MKM2_9BACT|nr:hypothetical protein SAMN04488504_10238 [Myxococcus virescens]
MHPRLWWPASLLLVCLACESVPRKAHETEHYGFISDDSDYVWARGVHGLPSSHPGTWMTSSTACAPPS